MMAKTKSQITAPLAMDKPAERCADPLDEASALTDTLTRAAIVAASIAACRKEYHVDFDGKHCVECGDPLPTERLTAGRVRCTACQAELEQQSKRTARLQPAATPWAPAWSD